MSISTKSILTLSATVLLSSLSMAQTASAQDLKATVSYSQSELQTKAGVARVYNRITKAATQICAGPSRSIDRLPLRQVRACVADVTREALQPEKYAVLASFNDSIARPGKRISTGQLTQNNWSFEKFQNDTNEKGQTIVSNETVKPKAGFLP